mgnify:CR=1 FL=1
MNKIDPSEIFVNRKISLRSLMHIHDFVDYSIVRKDDMLYLLFLQYDYSITWDYVKMILQFKYPVKWKLSDDGLNYAYHVIEFSNCNRLEIYEYKENMNTENVFSFARSDYGMINTFINSFKYWIENDFYIYNLYVIKDNDIIDEYHLGEIKDFDQIYEFDIDIDKSILSELKRGF